MSTKKHLRIRALTEGAMLVAAAQVLSYLKLYTFPQGGSVTPAMFPILLYALRWGLGRGLLAGFAYGTLQLIFDGAYAWGWQSMLLDYVLAFTVLGFSGIFAGQKRGIFYGTVLGCILRFIVHYIAGVTIWRIYGPTELFNTTFLNPRLYSAVYNGSYVAIDMVLCLVIFALLYKPLKKFFLAEDLK